MLVSTALRLGDIMYLILILEICIITVIEKGRVLLEIPSMHKLVQYLQTLHRNEDIYELIENTSWKVLAYGIYARVVDVSEIERVSAANE